MRILYVTLLKLAAAVFLLFTSVYCLLTFLPYTYYALIKAPPYAWMRWLVEHHAAVYWALLLAAVAAYWSGRRLRGRALFFGVLTVGGVWLAWHPLLPTLASDWPAYRWSLVALLPIAVAAVAEVWSAWPRLEKQLAADRLLPYSTAVVAAVAAALISAGGVLIHGNGQARWDLGPANLELAAWSALSHAVAAVIVVSIVNLVTLAAAKYSHGAGWRRAILAALAWGAAWWALSRFLANTLSFDNWAAQVYAAALAATLVLFGISLALPLWTQEKAVPARGSSRLGTAVTLALLASLSALALALPSLIEGGDWNGILQSTFALIFWVALTVGFYRFRGTPQRYSAGAIAACLLVTCFAYWALVESAVAWAGPLGSTDDEISRAMDAYAARDASYGIAQSALGRGRTEDCGDLCRILRQHTNIRGFQVKKESNLVKELVPVQGERPDIFIFVIDSLRPDYLGAYDPKVDFTPNLDAFAHDSVVFRNAYTQYLGTTLSEPAIWAGALLLHTHYVQPFRKVNALEKLVRTNDYRMVVSYDTVLSQLLAPDGPMVKLDGNVPLWNNFEICGTLRQATAALDADPQRKQPVFFFAQPMNVHQFASNQLPSAAADHWQLRAGFNSRVAHEVHQVDECLGRFFAYLKSRGRYDDSIIVLTSDHGDALGEYGRYSHSASVYPEVVRVPLIVHLPKAAQAKFVHDDNQIAALTDITPSLYSLLGYGPIESNGIFGHPLFTESREELQKYSRSELFLASDTRAVYGLLAGHGRFLYATYDSPAQSFLFDLTSDPTAEHNIITPGLKKDYDRRIILRLQAIADFYGYKPGLGSLLEAQGR